LPIYTYQCQQCGNSLEARQSFNAEPLTVCEACGGALRRTLHSVGIIFKGSGFYNTDYKRSTSVNGESGANGAKENGKASDSKQSASAESKPAEASSSTVGSSSSKDV
jgi:putative FmdB family regulatory protein